MADVLDDTFLLLVSGNFRFLEEDYGFQFTGINAIMSAYENDQYRIRINYDERSGYVGFSVLVKRNDEEVFLEDLCMAFGGTLKQFERGLAAYDLNVLAKCINRLANSIRVELRDFLSGDEATVLRAMEVSNRQREKVLDDMEFGGARMSANEAWDKQDYFRYLETIARIPNEKLTGSEKRRVKIAEIKLGHQTDS